MGEGFCFYATVQSVQVGGGGWGDDKHDFRVAGVADDPALSRVDAVVGADFPGEGIGDGSRLQDGGALVRITGDGDVSGPVSGGEQGQDPPGAGQGERGAGPRHGGPEPAAMMADITTGPV